MNGDRQLHAHYDLLAPDLSEVRILASAHLGSMAHFTLQPHQISTAVCHRTVEEIWFILAGSGQMWRAKNGAESIVELVAGLSLTIPVGTHFQFRNTAATLLQAVAVTMPKWPGPDEAYTVEGKW